MLSCSHFGRTTDKSAYINASDNVHGDEFDAKAYMRKEQNDFGWDWSPSLAPAGPWRPAYFIQQAKSDAVIVDNSVVDIYRRGQRNNLSPDQSQDWVFNVSVDYLGALPRDARLHLDLRDGYRLVKSVDLDIRSANNMTVTGDAVIHRDSVELWWPNGMGAQKLYQATVTISSRSWRQPAVVSKRVGFRTIVLDLNPVTPEQLAKGVAPGANWHFEINGREMYAKGANLVPIDVFWTRVTTSKVRELFQLAVNAHQNMLRVWASGTYLSDEIYDLADEMGLLLWSEFQFTDAQYPVTPDYIANYEAEAYYNVRRVNHHPSVALWAGGNELEAIILQFFNGPGDVRDGYEKLTLEILIKCVYANTRSISYIPSSTYHGYTKLDFDSVRPQTPRYDQTQGAQYIYANTDTYDADASQAFNYSARVVGRFATEFGSISLPSLQSWRGAIDAADLYVQSPSVLHHNRHVPFGSPGGIEGSLAGLSEATSGVVEWYPQPDIPDSVANFSAWCWATQVYQADKYAAEIAFYRRGSAHRERQLGSLFWQLNDLWVAPTWAAVESSGRQKVMYYATKDIYTPVIVWPFYDVDTDTLDIWVISDRPQEVHGTVDMRWSDWNGKALALACPGFKNATSTTGCRTTKRIPFQVGALNGTRVFSYNRLSTLLPTKGNSTNALLSLNLQADGASHSTWFRPVSLAKTHLPDPGLEVKTIADGGSVTFRVTAHKAVAANVWLDHPDSVRGYFDYNGFWLNKGQTKEVKFTVWEGNGNWVAGVKVRSLWDTTQKSSRPFA